MNFTLTRTFVSVKGYEVCAKMGVRGVSLAVHPFIPSANVTRRARRTDEERCFPDVPGRFVGIVQYEYV